MASTQGVSAGAALATAAREVEQEPPYGWVVVWACFVALAVIFGVAYSFAAFFESFARAYAAKRADVSLVFGLSGLLYFVLGAFGGMLSDRYGPRRVTSAGMLCIVAALLLGSVSTSMLQLTLAWGIGLGVGIALVYTPAIACVQPWFTRRRGLAAGVASAGIGAGTFGVPLLAAAAIGQWQWRGAMVALAAGTVLVGLAATLALRAAPAATRRAGVAAAGLALGAAGAHAFVRVALRDVRAGRPGDVHSVRPPLGRCARPRRERCARGRAGRPDRHRQPVRAFRDRRGRRPGRPVLDAGRRPGFAGPGDAAVAGGRWLSALAVFALWMGVSYGGIVSLMPAMCMDLYGARAVASIIGTLYTGAALGNVAGPWLAGRVFDAQGSYARVIAGCAVLSALSTFAAWRAMKR